MIPEPDIGANRQIPFKTQHINFWLCLRCTHSQSGYFCSFIEVEGNSQDEEITCYE